MKAMMITAMVILAVQAQAGDNGGGTLSCSSASGRTKITGMAGTNYGGIGPAVLTLDIDGATIELNAEKAVSAQSVMVDFVSYKHKVSYEATIKRAFIHSSADGLHTITDSVLRLVSVKGSMKSLGGERLEFLVDMPSGESLDPRTFPDLNHIDLSSKKLEKDVQLKCVLDVGV